MRHFAMLALALACLSAWAETYRWVDPASGRVVISDHPPPGNVRKFNKTASSEQAAELPLVLKQAVDNFPVTLYTSPDCVVECRQARDLLNARGIPFTEKKVQKPEDAEELKKLVGDVFVPSLLVGKQVNRGFLADTYNNLLDLAGYPKSPMPGFKPAAKQEQ